MPYVMGVNTSMPSQRKSYVPCRGCEVTQTFSRARIVFLLTVHHTCTYTHAILRLLKKVWVWVHPQHTGRDVH